MNLLKRPTKYKYWTPFINLSNELNLKSYHLKSLVDKGILEQSYQDISRVLIKKSSDGTYNLFSCYLKGETFCPYEVNK